MTLIKVLFLLIIAIIGIEKISYNHKVSNSKFEGDKIIVFNGITGKYCFVRMITGDIREGKIKDNECIGKQQ